MTTKEKILVNSLKLFSKKGYNGTSVRDIAYSVGIKESSLYNHFKSKQDIFDSVVDFCFEKAREYFNLQEIPFDRDDDISIYCNVDTDTLVEIIIKTFGYFFEDEYNKMFRQLLINSRFENKTAEDIYIKLYVDYPLEFQSGIFKMLMDKGKFRRENPMTVAREFYGVIFMLIHTGQSLEQAKPVIESHVKQFIRNYSI
ncbi:MAG: TetR/AcrR family transcriptional regulator [Oscillospiraceae bacterium]|nr:TetR/AcrR family transcriptional regulator [Oscillospiraceae bacterium]